MGFNQSPWLYELDKTRTPHRLPSDLETDVVIVGAGIAGISTAFFALKYTTRRVVVLDQYLLAHGATGNNAGQVVSYFERGFSSLVDEFGLELAAAGQKSIDDAWGLLDEMFTDAGLNIPFARFLGYAGVTSREQVLWYLHSSQLRTHAGLHADKMLLAETCGFLDEIPREYAELYEIRPVQDIAAVLETEMREFIAALPYQKGCLNSALFCQEVHAFLMHTYPERYQLYEHTPVHKIILRGNSAILDADTYTITAARVVLCTNGFESLHIINETGLDIDAKYHHLVQGKIGYMSGYLERMTKQPTAISYFTDPTAGADNSYFYLTRRPYEFRKHANYNLISVGGPDRDLDDLGKYSHEDAYPHSPKAAIDSFIRRVYNLPRHQSIHYLFTWHGLMGYTRNGVRLIGPEPQNDLLLYNLGCNGVGILPSIYGGKRIAQYLNNEKVPASIFDVPRRVAAGVQAPAHAEGYFSRLLKPLFAAKEP